MYPTAYSYHKPYWYYSPLYPNYYYWPLNWPASYEVASYCDQPMSMQFECSPDHKFNQIKLQKGDKADCEKMCKDSFTNDSSGHFSGQTNSCVCQTPTHERTCRYTCKM